MRRIVRPELLDSLSPDDPAAQANRRDLRLVNRAMGNFEWLAGAAAARLRPGERALEIGAGTGELGLELARRGVPTDGLDLWPRPPAWPDSNCWHRIDARAFDGYGEYAVVIGSLIFHQFQADELAELGRRLGRTRLILASEPWRRRLSQWLCAAAAPFVRANHVSRHDARVSIAGGFRGDELPRMLGLARPGWTWDCGTTGLGAYRMMATQGP
ncbi:MAG: SAM-dependent methyltransferase [Opitutaceae bacterium]